MKKELWAAWAICIFTVCILIWGVTPVVAGNVLSNPGFEFDPSTETQATQSFPGWTAYGSNAFGETGPAAHTGTNYFLISSAFSGNVNYNGVLQDYISGPGATYSADGWAMTASPNLIAGQNTFWLEVSFHDANANILALYRSSLISTDSIANGTFPADTWIDLPVTNQYDPNTFTPIGTVSSLVAPAGTCFVRCQIVFQGDAANSGGSAEFDDLTLNLTSSSPFGNWNVVWSDEFNGSSIDANTWTFDLGSGGWGNNELEYYTDRTNNVFVAGGLLHIVARSESYNGSSFTSARLKTAGLVSFLYGRFEWRARFPAGTGFWPALWFLGTNYPATSWPACGEIDAAENIGSMPDFIQGTLHSGSDETGYYYFLNGDSTTNFHTYDMDWNTNNFTWYVDGHLYETQTNWLNYRGQSFPSPYNLPEFMLMDLAIGGDYNGDPTVAEVNANGAFPAELLVDYVRVYNINNSTSFIAPSGLSARLTNNNLLISWSGTGAHLQAQYPSANAGLNSAAWTDLPYSNSPALLNLSNTSAFFRLKSP